MKPPRTLHPIPRTLSAEPPAMLRAPSTSHYQARFPALAVALAGGALVPACHDPVCGTSRADELEAHGASGARALRNGEGSRALREIGVALGLSSHGATTVPDLEVAGAAPMVQVTPPVQTPPPVQVVPETPIATAGAPMPVNPTPPPVVNPRGPNTTRPTHPPPANRGGAVSPVSPTPRPSRGEAAPVTPQPPRPEPQLEGDVVRVGPLPARLRNARS